MATLTKEQIADKVASISNLLSCTDEQEAFETHIVDIVDHIELQDQIADNLEYFVAIKDKNRESNLSKLLLAYLQVGA